MTSTTPLLAASFGSSGKVVQDMWPLSTYTPSGATDLTPSDGTFPINGQSANAQSLVATFPEVLVKQVVVRVAGFWYSDTQNLRVLCVGQFAQESGGYGDIKTLVLAVDALATSVSLQDPTGSRARILDVKIWAEPPENP